MNQKYAYKIYMNVLSYVSYHIKYTHVQVTPTLNNNNKEFTKDKALRKKFNLTSNQINAN